MKPLNCFAFKVLFRQSKVTKINNAQKSIVAILSKDDQKRDEKKKIARTILCVSVKHFRLIYEFHSVRFFRSIYILSFQRFSAVCTFIEFYVSF